MTFWHLQQGNLGSPFVHADMIGELSWHSASSCPCAMPELTDGLAGSCMSDRAQHHETGTQCLGGLGKIELDHAQIR